MNARQQDPLTVVTQDGSTWWKRAVDRDGHGLYARGDSTGQCPTLRTIRQLAEFGLRSMPAAVPLPADSELSEVERLRAERHETNEWVDDAAEALRTQRDRIAELEAQRKALVERLRAGQRWQRGRNPELVSENFVSQSELREIFGIPLTAPWEGDAEDPFHSCGCPKRFDRHSWGCPTLRDEDPFGLHHSYRVGRDLPELGGVQ